MKRHGKGSQFADGADALERAIETTERQRSRQLCVEGLQEALEAVPDDARVVTNRDS